MYYNTTNESGETLKRNKVKAKTQEDLILLKLGWATSQDNDFTTSASVFIGLEGFQNTPITSIRRAITNLVKKGDIIYTGEKRLGLYGRNERLIKLA